MSSLHLPVCGLLCFTQEAQTGTSEVVELERPGARMKLWDYGMQNGDRGLHCVILSEPDL